MVTNLAIMADSLMESLHSFLAVSSTASQAFQAICVTFVSQCSSMINITFRALQQLNSTAKSVFNNRYWGGGTIIEALIAPKLWTQANWANFKERVEIENVLAKLPPLARRKLLLFLLLFRRRPYRNTEICADSNLSHMKYRPTSKNVTTNRICEG